MERVRLGTSPGLISEEKVERYCTDILFSIFFSQRISSKRYANPSLNRLEGVWFFLNLMGSEIWLVVFCCAYDFTIRVTESLSRFKKCSNVRKRTDPMYKDLPSRNFSSGLTIDQELALNLGVSWKKSRFIVFGEVKWRYYSTLEGFSCHEKSESEESIQFIQNPSWSSSIKITWEKQTKSRKSSDQLAVMLANCWLTLHKKWSFSPSTLRLQRGQVCWRSSQGSTQSLWNSWRHGNTLKH